MAHTVIKTDFGGTGTTQITGSTLPAGTHMLPNVNVNSAYGTFVKSVINDVWDNNYAGKYTDIAIGGKLVSVNINLSYSNAINLTPDAIKWRIADHLVKYMIENKLIEFTRRDDPISLSQTINARCYLAPDDNVRVLRQMTPNT